MKRTIATLATAALIGIAGASAAQAAPPSVPYGGRCVYDWHEGNAVTSLTYYTPYVHFPEYCGYRVKRWTVWSQKWTILPNVKVWSYRTGM